MYHLKILIVLSSTILLNSCCHLPFMDCFPLITPMYIVDSSLYGDTENVSAYSIEAFTITERGRKGMSSLHLSVIFETDSDKNILLSNEDISCNSIVGESFYSHDGPKSLINKDMKSTYFLLTLDNYKVISVDSVLINNIKVCSEIDTFSVNIIARLANNIKP